jgi:hypothetical protein
MTGATSARQRNVTLQWGYILNNSSGVYPPLEFLTGFVGYF